ncbi:MAG: hypothetical protein R3277_09020 [Brumimicrobium sp.]|nr:hypothetical protein [Brumimicrobium sp.]
MKKLMILFAVSLFSLGLSAQNAKVEGNKEALKKNVEKGVIEFIMPENTQAAEIEKSAQYYVDYFTVQYNPTTRVAKITMVDNTPESRRVINRLLLSNGVRTIEFDGQKYSISDFYSNFLE